MIFDESESRLKFLYVTKNVRTLCRAESEKLAALIIVPNEASTSCSIDGDPKFTVSNGVYSSVMLLTVIFRHIRQNQIWDEKNCSTRK